MIVGSLYICRKSSITHVLFNVHSILVFTMKGYHVDRYLFFLFLMSLASVTIQLGILLILNLNVNPVGLLDIPAPHSYPFQRKIPLRAYHEYIRKYIHT
jgi:hypothetical protein